LENSIVRFVEDIHGNYEQYKTLVEGADLSIQVGDFGMGFDHHEDQEMYKWQEDNPQHWFIRGNHDDPAICGANLNYLGDYGTFHNDGLPPIFYIGGAWSIDYYWRTPNVNWWEEEELTQEQFDHAEKLYLRAKPEIVVSHDAPVGVPTRMNILNPTFGPEGTTRTSYRLRQMFEQHRPKWWFFGHWHRSGELNHVGTTFKCLAEFETCDFDLKGMKIV